MAGGERGVEILGEDFTGKTELRDGDDKKCLAG